MGLLRKAREIGTVMTPERALADLRDAERNAERMPTARNIERVERARAEAARVGAEPRD